MTIELHAGGRVQFLGPQQRWDAGPSDESKGVLETALFAGQRMMAITDDAGGFELHYLGFATGGFRTMDIAKHAAPEFARRVLRRFDHRYTVAAASSGVDRTTREPDRRHKGARSRPSSTASAARAAYQPSLSVSRREPAAMHGLNRDLRCVRRGSRARHPKRVVFRFSDSSALAPPPHRRN